MPASLYDSTYEDTSAHTHTQTPAKRPSLLFHPVQSYICHSLRTGPSLAQENICRIIHKNLLRLHPVSGWIPVPSTKPSGWVSAPSDICCNWKPESTKALGHKSLILERSTATLLENDGPAKRTELKNGTLFDLLPMDIVNVIDDCLIGLEHCETFKPIVESIKYPCIPVLRMCKNQHLVPYLYFRNELIYQ